MKVRHCRRRNKSEKFLSPGTFLCCIPDDTRTKHSKVKSNTALKALNSWWHPWCLLTFSKTKLTTCCKESWCKSREYLGAAKIVETEKILGFLLIISIYIFFVWSTINGPDFQISYCSIWPCTSNACSEEQRGRAVLASQSLGNQAFPVSNGRRQPIHKERQTQPHTDKEETFKISHSAYRAQKERWHLLSRRLPSQWWCRKCMDSLCS